MDPVHVVLSDNNPLVFAQHAVPHKTPLPMSIASELPCLVCFVPFLACVHAAPCTTNASFLALSIDSQVITTLNMQPRRVLGTKIADQSTQIHNRPWQDWAQDDILNPPRRTHTPEWHNPLSTRSNVLPAQQSERQSSHPSTPLQIDALLRSNPSGEPALAWDIIDPPDRAQRTLDRLFALPSFDDVATTPRCTRIQIKYDHPTFGSLVNGFGPIEVFSERGDSHVLLRDVLKAIYLHFQQPITGEEWASLSVPERNQVSRYQAARFRDRRHLYYNAAQTPVIRGDFLRECTVFSGLHIESCLGSSCVLRMDLLPLNPSNDLR
ncbi:hypothetical protein Hypma_011680 [Hypsizygus marmoreus]|uniref:DUF6699 domain-containing protein n=1 Tax=Hypsizygus marmoreus TaxID=39966 RepID=A0A369JR47_HYPMA|nr:hypothetical protein Hypma_011680 [Hypsizygus marmoreus]